MYNWVRSSEESVATMLMEDADHEMLLESADDDAADPDEKKWLARQARQKKAQKLYRYAARAAVDGLSSIAWDCCRSLGRPSPYLVAAWALANMLLCLLHGSVP